MSNADPRICLGAFAGAHGVRGDAVIKTFTEAPENIDHYGTVESEDGSRRFTLTFVRAGKPGFAIVRVHEIASREEAAALKGERIYVERSALPPPEDDEFYLDDLIGLEARNEASEPVGQICAVHNFGAGDLLELENIPGVKGTRMIPFSKMTVPEIDLLAGTLTISKAALDTSDGPSISDETGEIVSDDLNVDLSAMREEDA